MGISQYIKTIGRGSAGARALTREQACDLMGQVLDGLVSDLEVGGFCLAMRIKGETPDEMAGFLDAAHERLSRLPDNGSVTVVLPSYNGARRLPVLTPLLAMLLAREGLPVLVHGAATEDRRISSEAVFSALGLETGTPEAVIQAGSAVFLPTERLSVGLKRLLDVRRVVGLRNPAHSLVKLMNPCAGKALIIGSYTHPEYATSMAETFALTGAHAMLLRGTEGEPVADARRTPRMESFYRGERHLIQPAHEGPLTALPDLPADNAATSTATYVRAVLDGKLPVPVPIALQVKHIVFEARDRAQKATIAESATADPDTHRG